MKRDPFEVDKAYEHSKHSRTQNAALGGAAGAAYGGAGVYGFQGSIRRGGNKMASRAAGAGGPRYAKVRNLANNAGTPGEADTARGMMRKLESKMGTKQRLGIKTSKLFMNPKANKIGLATGVIGGATAIGAGEGALHKHKKSVAKAFSLQKTAKTVKDFSKFTRKVVKSPVNTKDKVKLIGGAAGKAAKHDPVGFPLAAGVAAAGAAAAGTGAHQGKEHLVKSAFGVQGLSKADDTKKRVGLAATGAGLAAGGGYGARQGYRMHQAVRGLDDTIKEHGRYDAGGRKTMRRLKLGTAAGTALGAGTAVGGVALAHRQAFGGKKVKKNMAESAFGIEHVSKAKQEKASAGRRVTAQLAWPIHGAVAAKKGKKLRTAGRQLGEGMAGHVGGAMVGGALGGAVSAASKGKINPHTSSLVGGHLGSSAGTVAGVQHSVSSSQRKGYFKSQKVAKSAFGVEHVSKAKSEKGLLGNGRSDGSNALLHRGRGSNSKLLHDGRGSGKVLLHSGKAKGRLVKTLGDGRATIDTKLGAK